MRALLLVIPSIIRLGWVNCKLSGGLGVALGWLWGSLGVALVWLWWSLGVALVELWGGFGVPMRCLSTGFEVALRWLWGGFVLRSLCLVYAYNMALGWLWVACSPSSFKVQGSMFDVRRSASGRNLKRRKAACRPSAVSLAHITRPGGGWRRSRESESDPRRVSGDSPLTLADSRNRVGSGIPIRRQ